MQDHSLCQVLHVLPSLYAVQEVAGLLQDQLQRHACLVSSLLGQHAALLLEHGPSLDILLRIVPLLPPTQQADVYQSFAAYVTAETKPGRQVC